MWTRTSNKQHRNPWKLQTKWNGKQTTETVTRTRAQLLVTFQLWLALHTQWGSTHTSMHVSTLKACKWLTQYCLCDFSLAILWDTPTILLLVWLHTYQVWLSQSGGTILSLSHTAGMTSHWVSWCGKPTNIFLQFIFCAINCAVIYRYTVSVSHGGFHQALSPYAWADQRYR